MFSSLFPSLRNRPTTRRAVQRTCRPVIEALEDRQMLNAAQINVEVFKDLNLDGLRQATEPGMPRWTVQLYDHGGPLVVQQLTNRLGLTDFLCLAPGDYVVRQIVKPFSAQTTQLSGGGGQAVSH